MVAIRYQGRKMPNIGTTEQTDQPISWPKFVLKTALKNPLTKFYKKSYQFTDLEESDTIM